MSGELTKFRAARSVRRKIEAANDERTELGPSIDLAVWLHNIIIDGLRLGQFSGHKDGPAGALDELFSRLHRTGTNYIETAEEHFELVYGSDPYTFIDRLAGRHRAPRPGPLTI